MQNLGLLEVRGSTAASRTDVLLTLDLKDTVSQMTSFVRVRGGTSTHCMRRITTRNYPNRYLNQRYLNNLLDRHQAVSGMPAELQQSLHLMFAVAICTSVQNRQNLPQCQCAGA